MSLNPETGQMWMTEQGPNGGDEVNILKPGANYGWPSVSNGRNYMGPKISDSPSPAGHRAASRCLGALDRGGRWDLLHGRCLHRLETQLLRGWIREGETPRTGQLQRIEFNEQWEEVRREPMLRELQQRIRDVRQGPDGLLYLVTGEAQGALLRIEPAGPPTGPTSR